MTITKKELSLAVERCDEIAESIEAIAQGFRRLQDSRLNDRALVMLIQAACPSDRHSPKPGKRVIELVLAGVASLDEAFVRDEED